MEKRGKILEGILRKIKPSEREIEIISLLAKEFCSYLKGAFIGGSLGKNTIIKKDGYDIDIFVRFKKKEGISELLESQLKSAVKKFEVREKKLERIHGSRDYFQFRFKNRQLKMPILFEIVPVLDIRKPGEAENVTDLSYFHINYVKKRIKRNQKLADDIRLAKAFCFAQNCYGAESHIRGFSGYALEILVLHFGSFINLLRAASKWDEQAKQIILDPAKYYKSKQEIMLNLNDAKLQSPLILIDPTFKIRSISAGLSKESFSRFIKACRNFLRKPSEIFFSKQIILISEWKSEAKKRNAKLAVIEAVSSKDKRDIAAAKLAKFFNFLSEEMQKREFKILNRELEFYNRKAALFIIYKTPAASEIIEGPPISMEEHTKSFKKQYKRIFIKQGRIFAQIKRRIREINDLLKLIKSSEILRDMDIKSIIKK